jgi:hypothetical protein
MVKSLRICGREPLRSAHRLFGFIIVSCFWDPSHRLVTRPSREPRCLQDPICLAAPDSFLWRHHHRDPVAMRLITATFARGRGGGCLCCSRDGPGHFVGSPPHWISASTGLETLAFYWRQDRKRYSRRDAKDVRAEFRRNQAPFAATVTEFRLVSLNSTQMVVTETDKDLLGCTQGVSKYGRRKERQRTYY